MEKPDDDNVVKDDLEFVEWRVRQVEAALKFLAQRLGGYELSEALSDCMDAFDAEEQPSPAEDGVSQPESYESAWRRFNLEARYRRDSLTKAAMRGYSETAFVNLVRRHAVLAEPGLRTGVP